MMIGSATRTTTGKKVIGIFVAIAMVLTMSNISAYYASATTDDTEAQTTEETTTDEKVETTETTEAEVPEKVTEAVETVKAPEPEAKKGPAKPKVMSAKVKGAFTGDEPTTIAEGVETGAYRINYTYVDENGVATDVFEDHDATIGESVKVTLYSTMERDGANYVLAAGTDTTQTIVIQGGDAGINTIQAVYYKDEIGKDGIADKDQRTIKYVVDGKTLKTEVVTLKDGSATINFPDTGIEIDGKHRIALGWTASSDDKGITDDSYVVTSDMAKTGKQNAITFTYKYEVGKHGFSYNIVYMVDDPLENGPVEDARDSKTIYTSDYDVKGTLTKEDLVKSIESAVNAYTKKFYAGTKFDKVIYNYPETMNSEGFEIDPDYGTEINGNGEEKEHLCIKDLGEVKVTYTYDYVPDENHDGIDDTYQIKVIYKINNGTFKSTGKSVNEVWYTLKADGVNSEFGTCKAQMPYSQITPNKGYTASTEVAASTDAERAIIKNIGWYMGGAKVSTTSTGMFTFNKSYNNVVIEYNYVPQLQPYTIYVYNEDNKAAAPTPFEGVIRYNPANTTVTIGEGGDIEFPVVDGLVAPLSNQTMTVDPTKSTPNVIGIDYAGDAMGTDDVNAADGIADKYQVKVVIRAINGTVIGNPTQVVTLRDANGQLSENGTGHLSKYFLAMPNTGFEGGKWSPATPTADFNITKNTTQFTITYSSISDPLEFVDDDEPTTDGDDNDTNNNAGNGADVFVGTFNPDTTADTADEATEPEADGDEVIADDQTPLAAPADEQTIADDENALAGYEEGSEQTWLPFAIVAGVLCAGLLLFLVARRKNDEEDARSAY